MLHPGGARRRIARTLNTAYAGGLLSEDTFASRLDQVLKSRLIDPLAVIGDLNSRRARPRLASLRAAARAWARVLTGDVSDQARAPLLLALDWSGAQSELLVGRHRACDVVLGDSSVSRRHARLVFRDAKWIVQDLQSTNGTIVNGARVGRCEVRPGDYLLLGEQYVKID